MGAVATRDSRSTRTAFSPRKRSSTLAGYAGVSVNVRRERERERKQFVCVFVIIFVTSIIVTTSLSTLR